MSTPSNSSQEGCVWLALRPQEIRTRLGRLGWTQARTQPGLFPRIEPDEPLDHIYLDEPHEGRIVLWRLDDRWWTPPGVFPCRLDVRIREVGPRLTELRWVHRLHDFAMLEELARRMAAAVPYLLLGCLFMFPMLVLAQGIWVLFVGAQAVLMALAAVALVAYKRCERAEDVTQRLYGALYGAVEADVVHPGSSYRG